MTDSPPVVPTNEERKRAPGLSISREKLERQARTFKESAGNYLLGVTGGIASGKSTVCSMLEALGYPLVDLDVLARKVVEPGRSAWRQIVERFGKEVLFPDETLDRKKLAGIVFRNPALRDVLEGFTHPPIFDELFDQMRLIADRDPGAVIQVAVPLLVELDLKFLFHGVLLVYVPRGVQLSRLMTRDGIDREAAEDRLRAQLPLDSKVSYADFVIDNQGTMEETRRQVEALRLRLDGIRSEGTPQPRP